jgi:hypothetical protein
LPTPSSDEREAGSPPLILETLPEKHALFLREVVGSLIISLRVYDTEFIEQPAGVVAALKVKPDPLRFHMERSAR